MRALRSFAPARAGALGVGLVCGLLAGLVPAQQPAPSHALLDSGPMVGHATETTCSFWVRTKRPANVQIRARREGDPGQVFFSDISRSSAAADYCIQPVMEGLPFGQRFEYELLLNGESVDLPWPLHFKTAPHWRYRHDPPEFDVILGSCRYHNEKLYDRPGKPYGDEPGILRTIAGLKPDLMIWLGDNVYFREPDWTSRSAMARRYAYSRRATELQPLLGATHHYAIWDDHDFGPDNSDWTFSGRRDALRVFRWYWANPRRGTPRIPGIFTRFTWGDVEFFLTDGRYHRRPEHAPADEDKRMFGEAQMSWLLDALTGSRATFKIVAVGSQVLNDSTEHECLADYPVEREELLHGLAERDISGVIFVTGDRHHSELLRLERPGTYPLYDFTCSPLSAGAGSARGEEDNPLRVPGSRLGSTRNFGRLRFLGAGEDRRTVFELFDREGRRRFQFEAFARDVR